MKVDELEGKQLAYWVARSLGFTNADVVPSDLCGWEHIEGEGFRKEWEPHEDWAQGGPIIDREIQELSHICKGRWCASNWNNNASFGPTPLIAAMRAYISSKFGDEVPDQVA
jgi:hypothetical protein